MPSKELKFTKGYDQAELDAWWKRVGYPGEAPRVPEFLKNSYVGNGRDAYGIYTYKEGAKGVKDWTRQTKKDLGGDQFKEAMAFRNQLGKFSDPFREQSGISKVAGGILDVATLAFPQMALMRGVSEAGNAALKNPQKELEEALVQNVTTNTGGGGSDVMGPLSALNREQAPGPTNYLRYGMGPEHTFFRPTTPPVAPTEGVPVGVAPPDRVGSTLGGTLSDRIRGIIANQQQPLAEGGAVMDSFSVDGRTGNKTTNKDLPQWLRDLGMKGDAYAGGMLKPELRYGFKYKKGKINFADGRVFDAKKQKDGSYSYTDESGQAATYDPTDEQDAYNKAYKKSTSNQSFMDKASNLIGFELDHGKQILKGVWDDPRHILFGVDPLGSKIGSEVTGKKMNPLVDQMGGALDTRYADYEARTGKATGYAKDMQDVAHVVASIYGGKGLGKLAGAGAKSFAATEAGSGVLGNAATTGAKLLASNPKLVQGALSAGNAALSADGAAAIAANGNTGIVPPVGGGTSLPASTFDRIRSNPGVGVRYGMGSEGTFYRPPMAEGGALKHYPLRPKGKPSQELRNFSNLPGMDDPRVRIAVGDRKTPTQFVSHGTGAGGRDDNIDAKLSENEYVIDAETVALLGDGSPEAGAKKLDTMRESIRRHKGQALAKGKISPDAKGHPLQYLAEGGKVSGALKALFKRKPKPDPNANLRRINSVLEQALRRPPKQEPRRATAEELERDVRQLRREVGPQGGDTRPLGRRKNEYARGGALTNYRGGK